MSNSYQQRYQSAKNALDMLQTIDLDVAFSQLDTALTAYMQTPTDANANTVNTFYMPIRDYYASLSQITGDFENILKDAGQSVQDGDLVLESEERYKQRAKPDEQTKARELMFGLFPTMKPATVPILLGVASFLALMSIFLIFMMFGVQIGLPPAVSGLFVGTPGDLPFYKNPMVLGGGVALLMISTGVFAYLYFTKK
jgi:hypothetical protein